MTRRMTRKSSSRSSSSTRSKSTSTSGRKSSSTGSRQKSGASRRSTRSRQSRSRQPGLDLSAILSGEVLGIAMLAVAILTFLAFISPSQGRITAGWLHLLRQGFGWGVYVVPFVLGIGGVWLLMRGFGRDLPIGSEQAIGVVLIWMMLLGLTHLVSEAADPWTLVVEGRAGGLLGWAVGQGLHYGLGQIGALVIVGAMIIIGILLIWGRSTSEIGMMLWELWAQLKGRLQEVQEVQRARIAQRSDYVIDRQPADASRPQRKPILGPTGTPAGLPLNKEPVGAPAGAPRSVLEAEPEPGLEVPDLAPQLVGSKSAGANWTLPKLSAVLEDLSDQEISQAEIEQRVSIIERTLESFGVPARVVEVNQGPAITQFGVEPGFTVGRGGKQTKVKVSKIAALADDLSLALAAAPIRIEAPVPGRSIVGVEVPNQEIALVSLRGVMETEVFEQVHRKTQLPIALGEDVSGSPVVADLIAMPHLLIAGATGSGKSVCINAIIAAFLCTNTPDDLQMVMVDPKRVELTGYNGIPHLLAPVVVDLERVVGTLRWVTREMDRRYRQFAKVGARNIVEYNRRVVAGGQGKLPYIVVIIDELADLMMIAPDDAEKLICRIAQMARATGIHLVIATQRPSVDVVTGLIKANFPARVSFMVTSSVDSRVIIDTTGAERLLGSGDMLYMSPSSSQVLRLQGCFVSPAELERLIGYWKSEAGQSGDRSAPRRELIQGSLLSWQEMQEPESEPLPGQEDEMLDKAIEVIRQEGRASITLLQRRLRIGYARAARIIVALEEQGIIGPDQGGSRGREVVSSPH